MNDGEQLSTVFLLCSLILAICTNLNSYRLFLPPKSIKCQIEMLPLHKRLVAEIKSQNPWYYEVSKCSPQEALRNLNKAFKRVWQVKGTGFPKFKKKNIKDSFYLGGSIKISGHWVKLPRIGWVKSHEQLPPVNPKNVTISKRAGDWYISFKIDVEHKATPKVRERIGVDLGIKTLATLSDGKTYPNPKAYRLVRKN